MRAGWNVTSCPVSYTHLDVYKILVEDAMVPFDTAVNSCTINPARCLGVDDRKGRIAVGCDADLVVLEDDYSVLQTWCRGRAML